MPEITDPAIKLFGKMIAFHAAESGGGGGGGEEEEEENKGHLTSKDREQESPDSKESSEPAVSSSEYDKGNHSSSDDQETAPENNSKAEEEDDDEEEEEHEKEQNDSSNPMLKKPDKILPCPRCNSLETKFCYYNNYNVNQPRHFCKNCQRYWTAGGTMRNVPVGAGRRKNKNSVASSLYHHLTVSDVGLQAIPGQIRRPPPLRSNGTVLSFGSDAPFCDTTASAPNLPEKQMISCHRNNGVHPAEEHMEEQSSNLSPVTRDCQSFSSTNVPCQFPWSTPPPAALCASSYPMPFYPAAAAYWGYNPWGLPWLSSLASPSPISGWSVSGPDHCPALGKHSREEDAVPGDSSSSERRRLWIPKTLRIHDPEEAAKSSIWTSMGFQSDDGQGFFETFQTKGELSRTHLGAASSQALHANPAALSRSINFLESS